MWGFFHGGNYILLPDLQEFAKFWSSGWANTIKMPSFCGKLGVLLVIRPVFCC